MMKRKVNGERECLFWIRAKRKHHGEREKSWAHLGCVDWKNFPTFMGIPVASSWGLVSLVMLHFFHAKGGFWIQNHASMCVEGDDSSNMLNFCSKTFLFTMSIQTEKEVWGCKREEYGVTRWPQCCHGYGRESFPSGMLECEYICWYVRAFVSVYKCACMWARIFVHGCVYY